MSIRQATEPVPLSEAIAELLGGAACSWPQFPCKPDADPCPYLLRNRKCECKKPNTEHGHLDATTDLAVIRDWWSQHPRDNVAIATGAPGPDVLDVDVREGGSGFAAVNLLKAAGLLAGASRLVRTPTGGLHIYFRGTSQTCGKLPRHFLDFKATGGYVLAPPSRIHGRPYELLDQRDGSGTLDWQACRRLLDPPKFTVARPAFSGPRGTMRFAGVLKHLSGLHDGEERWRQLHWAACRAAELIAAGKLSEADARAALLEASRANGYIADHGEREALRKIDRGFADGGLAGG